MSRELIVDRPVAGYYRMRLARKGPWVPVSIEPYGKEFSALVAIVGDERADLMDTWNWCCGQPISKATYDYMIATREWCERYDPSAPEANPRRAVDLSKLPPSF